jgi:hypothetical protein
MEDAEFVRLARISINRPTVMAHLLQSTAEHGELNSDELAVLLREERQASYLNRYLAFGLALGCLEPVDGGEETWSITPVGLDLVESVDGIEPLARRLLLAQPEYRHWCELGLARTLLALRKRQPTRPERVEAFLQGELSSYAPTFHAILDWLEKERAELVARLSWDELAESFTSWERQLRARRSLPLRVWDKELLGYASPTDDDRFNLLRDLWPEPMETPLLVHNRYLSGEPTAQRLLGCLVLAATRSCDGEGWWGVDIARFRKLHGADASGLDAGLYGLKQRLFGLGIYLFEAEGVLTLARPLVWSVTNTDWAEAWQVDVVLSEMPVSTCPPWPLPIAKAVNTATGVVEHSFLVELRKRVSQVVVGIETVVTLPEGLLAARSETGETLTLPSSTLLRGAFCARRTCYGGLPMGNLLRQQRRRLPRVDLWRSLYAHQPFVHLAMQLGLLAREEPDRLLIRREQDGYLIFQHGRAPRDFLDVAHAVLSAWGFRVGRVTVSSGRVFEWLEEIGILQQSSSDRYVLSDICHQWFMDKEGIREYHADQAYRDWLLGFEGDTHE